jgi:hypothetical protein
MTVMGIFSNGFRGQDMKTFAGPLSLGLVGCKPLVIFAPFPHFNDMKYSSSLEAISATQYDTDYHRIVQMSRLFDAF